MTGRTLSSRTSRGRFRAHRRGVSIAGLIVSMTALIALAALAIDFALLQQRSQEARFACDASALAGAGELWDRDLLCGNFQDLDMLSAAQPGESITDHQLRDMMFAAAAVGDKNQVHGQPLELQPSDFQVSGGTGVTSLTVQCPLTAARGNPVTRFFGRMLGQSDIDLNVESTAILDQRVFGFTPAGASPVLAAPLVVDPATWDAGACASGLVAVQLSLDNQGQQVGNARLLTLVPGAGAATSLTNDQIIDGLFLDDLTFLPNSALARIGGVLQLAAAADASVPTFVRICSALGALGPNDCRVFLLGAPLAGGGTEIVGFAAGRIVNCAVSSGTLTVEIRPCLLTTSTALLDPQQTPNPWIGKVYLRD